MKTKAKTKAAPKSRTTITYVLEEAVIMDILERIAVQTLANGVNGDTVDALALAQHPRPGGPATG